MLKGLFGPTTVSSMLRGGLEETSATHRAIADRVANALAASSSVDFPGQLKTAASKTTEEQLDRDMSELADTQLRYEAEAQLLRVAYAQLRSAIQNRG